VISDFMRFFLTFYHLWDFGFCSFL